VQRGKRRCTPHLSSHEIFSAALAAFNNHNTVAVEAMLVLAETALALVVLIAAAAEVVVAAAAVLAVAAAAAVIMIGMSAALVAETGVVLAAVVGFRVSVM
jgi:hypothetical protein